jgi:hypothetical protein
LTTKNASSPIFTLRSLLHFALQVLPEDLQFGFKVRMGRAGPHDANAVDALSAHAFKHLHNLASPPVWDLDNIADLHDAPPLRITSR